MATYAGKNIDDATSAAIETDVDFILYDTEYQKLGPEYIIERAREIQEKDPHVEVWVAFYKDHAEDDDFDVLAEAPIRDEPVTRFIVDERGNLRPVRD